MGPVTWTKNAAFQSHSHTVFFIMGMGVPLLGSGIVFDSKETQAG